MTHAAPDRTPGPMAVGGLWALAAAVAFGASTPLVQHWGRGVGPFTTAGLLYLGAVLVSVGGVRAGAGEPLRKRDLRLVGLVAALGAVVGPAALAWGLQHTSGVTASLLLNLEAVFTVVLARAVWSEPIGKRVGVALAAMTAGGVLLVARGASVSGDSLAGAVAVLVATAAWAADSTLGRPLSERDGAQVVTAKAAMGALASGGLAWALGESWPPAMEALCLGAAGALGYGVSLRLYLRAQRTLGAARTASVFASAPFVGAGVAWTMGQAMGGWATLAAGALCAVGVALHLTERHGHEHMHDAVEHEHLHSHDDLHHVHAHDGVAEGAHSHRHAHGDVTHAHPHALDVHHRHRH